MRDREPFLADDLADLDERLLSRAAAVVPMREIVADAAPDTIGLRHDVDNTFEPCVDLADWEAARGYRSTYYILHDAPYWDNEDVLRPGLERIAEHGHEIGIHANALTVALVTGGDPAEILDEAIGKLRGWGHDIRGVVGHGDPMCYTAGFVNDEIFSECARPEMGAPDRRLRHGNTTVDLAPRSLASFGLDYEAYRAGRRAVYLSDSGGRWNEPFDSVCDLFPPADGQLHVLIHPCWWVDAFAKVAA